MDSSQIMARLEQLDDDIDDIEDAIAPFIKKTIPEVASKLPLLDKAKLYTLVTYSIESILFSYLRLNGVNAREHPVFRELTRVKQYFEKINAAENPIGKRENLKLDKAAAGRFIKAGLSGNDKYDLQRAEEEAKQRARAHIKFTEISKKRKLDGEEIAATSEAAKTATAPDDSDSDSSSDSSSESSEVETRKHTSKKLKTAKAEKEAQSPADTTSGSKKKTKPHRVGRKKKAKAKKEKKAKKN